MTELSWARSYQQALEKVITEKDDLKARRKFGVGWARLTMIADLYGVSGGVQGVLNDVAEFRKSDPIWTKQLELSK